MTCTLNGRGFSGERVQYNVHRTFLPDGTPLISSTSAVEDNLESSREDYSQLAATLRGATRLDVRVEWHARSQQAGCGLTQQHMESRHKGVQSERTKICAEKPDGWRRTERARKSRRHVYEKSMIDLDSLGTCAQDHRFATMASWNRASQARTRRCR